MTRGSASLTRETCHKNVNQMGRMTRHSVTGLQMAGTYVLPMTGTRLLVHRHTQLDTVILGHSLYLKANNRHDFPDKDWAAGTSF